MSIATASIPASLDLLIRIPTDYAKTKAREMALWRLLYVLVIEALLVSYDIHTRSERFSRLGVIILISAFVFKPWLSLSSNTWAYAVNDKGIYLRDTSDFINSVGFTVIRWDRSNLLNFHIGEWHGYPTLNIEFLSKCRSCMMPIVFRSEDEEIVRMKLIPLLLKKYPIATLDAAVVS